MNKIGSLSKTKTANSAAIAVSRRARSQRAARSAAARYAVRAAVIGLFDVMLIFGAGAR